MYPVIGILLQNLASEFVSVLLEPSVSLAFPDMSCMLEQTCAMASGEIIPFLIEYLRIHV